MGSWNSSFMLVQGITFSSVVAANEHAGHPHNLPWATWLSASLLDWSKAEISYPNKNRSKFWERCSEIIKAISPPTLITFDLLSKLLRILAKLKCRSSGVPVTASTSTETANDHYYIGYERINKFSTAEIGPALLTVDIRHSKNRCSLKRDARHAINP